jgi:hypothetical protein
MNRRADFLVLVLAAAAAAGTAGAAEQSPKAYFRDYQRLADALRGEDCGDALAAALTTAQSPHFEVAVSRDGQVAFLSAVTHCALDQDEDEIGFRAAELWAARAPDARLPQVVRLYYGVQFERPAASVEALHALADVAPDAIREVELRFLGRLIQAAREMDDNGDQELAVCESILRAGYVPAPPYFDDFLRMGHGRLLLERGQSDAARERLAPVVDVESLVTMRIERLFDPLRGHRGFTAQNDLVAAAERDVARSRAAMEASPALMEAVYLHARVLDAAGRDEEAIALLDAALARHAADPAVYEDAEEFANWLGDTRGQLLYNVGRFDEGRAHMRAAALMQEHGEVNVSNILNYASHLLSEGLAKDALEQLPQVGEPSPYGRGVLESIRSCAAGLLGDEPQRSESLEYLKAHGRDNPSALSRAYLCANDLDGAAAWMIERLADRELRGNALLALQAMPDSAGDALPVRKMLLEHMAAVRARPDVREAADAVGRIESLPVSIHRGY